jgi:NAD(P)-dependent dehydrogenase (short-subunit alcohol dehydrogenase family)
MGAAAATLALAAGAEVVVMDVAEITHEGVTAIHVDLREVASIDAALDALGGPIDALFSCAGVADGTEGIERTNYVGHRYLIDQLIERGLLGQGGSIGLISSSAGLGWEANFLELNELLDLSDFSEATAWMVAHGKDNYMGAKQAVCAYVAREALAMLQRGIRINAICPGPTDTPLARANAETWLGMGSDYRELAGIEPSAPIEQAYPLLFLGSPAASAITGITLCSDAGWLSAGQTGSFPPASFVAGILLNRPPACEPAQGA